MAYVDLIMNLALLVALSILSGFVDKRWPRNTFAGVLLQGFLFGAVAITGMLRPLVLGPGLIFDGRSIIISLCALFFGHQVVSVTAAMAAAYRLALGGPGVFMGVSVILTSAVIGLLARHYIKPLVRPPLTSHLFFLGLAVHTAMVALMFTLPGELAMSTIKRLGLPVIILYPLATILAGKILSDQVAGLINIKSLHESKEHYRLMLESAPYAIFIQTEERFSYINPAGLRLFGASSPSDVIGRSVYERFHPDYIDIVRERIKNLNKERKTVPMLEQKYLKMDGFAIDVEVSAVPFIYEGKNGALVFVRDVSDRKKAEKALAESENLYRKLFEDHAAVKMMIDPDTGNIIDANEAAQKFYGWPLEKIKQMNISEINTLSPEEIKQELENARAAEKIFFEFRHRLADGSIRNVDVFSSKIEVKGKGLLHSIIHDVTERKQAEEEVKKLTQELEKRVAQRTEELHKSQLALLNVVDDLNENAKKLAAANEALQALNKELEAFAYSVSHDLRAPLRSIDGFSAALLEDYSGKFDKTGKDHLKRVRRAAQNMGELIDDLLKLSRVSKADFLPVSVNLSKMATETANTFKKQTGRKNIKIEVQHNLTAIADSALLQIALTNLIGNAFKFTSKKESTLIEFGTRQEGEQNIFYMRDNGVGFDMNYANKLFAPFQRLHNFDEFEGTGIGLATVQRIIHRHGGRVWAEGKVDKGATFYFTLPERGKVTNKE